MSRFQVITFILIVLCTYLGHCDDSDKSSGNAKGIFDSKSSCDQACKGDHDLDCKPIKAGEPQQVCRCASGFYSVQKTCQEECENSQFWSWFTYGSCSEYKSILLPGECNTQCVFGIRAWATAFIIIVFVAAVIIILTVLPMCIINLVACIRVKKHGRAIEDMHVAGDIASPSKSSGFTGAVHQAAAMSPYHQYSPYYSSYYHGAR